MRRNNLKKLYVTALLATLFWTSHVHAERIDIGLFSQNGLNSWDEKSFVGNTRYEIVNSENLTFVKAETNASASGLFREIDIDLNKTPYLNWSWKVANTYQGNDERSKDGDDYPARIYVVVSGGLFFWKTRAINYVWSSNQPVDTKWENAYTKNARMIALRSGENNSEQWLTEKRNIRDDLKQLFGEEIDEINAIAIMSDSDNSGQSATAWYGDIYFSSE